MTIFTSPCEVHASMRQGSRDNHIAPSAGAPVLMWTGLGVCRVACSRSVTATCGPSLLS